MEEMSHSSFRRSSSCEFPLSHVTPCEPFKKTRASTASSPRRLRFFVTTFPAVEKIHSDAVDDGGMARYFI